MKQARPCCIRMRAREQLSAHIVRLRHSRCCCMYVWAHTSVRGIFSANVNLCVLRHCVVRVRSFRRRRFLYVNHSIPSACYKTLGLGQHHVQKPALVGPCAKLKFQPGALIFAWAPAACPSQQTRTRAPVTISRPRSVFWRSYISNNTILLQSNISHWQLSRRPSCWRVNRSPEREVAGSVTRYTYLLASSR